MVDRPAHIVLEEGWGDISETHAEAFNASDLEDREILSTADEDEMWEQSHKWIPAVPGGTARSDSPTRTTYPKDPAWQNYRPYETRQRWSHRERSEALHSRRAITKPDSSWRREVP